MDCPACGAMLPVRSTACYACGTALAVPATAASSSSTGQARLPAGYSRPAGAVGPTTQSGATREGWRVPVSFLLGGLYAPFASGWLVAREEWSAGLSNLVLPPPPPSQRGGVMLAHFFGIPLLLLLTLGLPVQAASVHPMWDPVADEPVPGGWRNWEDVHRFIALNLPVALFYALSAVLARRQERRFGALVDEIMRSDARAHVRFRRGRGPVAVAFVLAWLPLVLLLWLGVLARVQTWAVSADSLAGNYVFACIVAAWSTSWLHISPYQKFQAAIGRGP